MKFSIKTLVSVQAFVLALLLVPVVAAQELKAQTSLTGRYEGTIKDSSGQGAPQEIKITLDLVDESGKFSGAVTTPRGVFKIIKGQMTDGTLELEFEPAGSAHKLSVRQKGDSWVGTALDGPKTASVELRKVKVDEISGEWDAAADAQGQPFPFTLSLQLDGEKVTGSSSSSLGNSKVSSGVWKDGKLAIVLDSTSGAIGLMATLDGGKLIGDYDFAGQLQGKWVAIKKK